MEIWKNIQGYENHYEISNQGRVRAKYREFVGKDSKVKKYHERILKFDINCSNTTSYYRVTLSKNHKTKRFQVHQLVAQHFIDNPENKPMVNHIDNNGLNNSVDNLEWCTHSENMVHAQKQGRLFKSQSKGGIKGAKTNKAKKQAKLQALKGQSINGYTILGENVSETLHTGFTRVNVICNFCGNTYVRSLSAIINKNCKGLGCISCSYKTRPTRSKSR